VARILVIDDDRCLRELLKLHLNSAGYEVELAGDAIEGGYAILRSPPDLLVVDVNMPYMSGIDLVATLIADSTVPAFPFVFLSSDESRMEQGYSLGAAAYVLKPVVKGRLLDAVARALGRSREVPRPPTARGEPADVRVALL
jgi:DNA-binding response OmpR family regulator